MGECGEPLKSMLCHKHNRTARNCLNMRRDKVLRHSQCEMHLAALEKERLAIVAAGDGGIAQAFERTVSMLRLALSGSLQILYWLAQNEVAHFTKFESLRTLCCDLGCDYFKELNLGHNANYSSNRMIDEWLQVLSNIVEEDILTAVRNSPGIGLMCDESTDISVTKELILYARILHGKEVKKEEIEGSFNYYLSIVYVIMMSDVY